MLFFVYYKNEMTAALLINNLSAILIPILTKLSNGLKFKCYQIISQLVNKRSVYYYYFNNCSLHFS